MGGMMSSLAEYEAGFSQAEKVQWHKDHLDLPIVAVMVYLMMIFTLRPYMKKHDIKPWFNVMSVKGGRWVWGVWNLLLAIFSCIGASRCLPKLLSIVADKGFTYSVCGGYEGYVSELNTAAADEGAPKKWDGSEWYTQGASGMWVWLFIYSKLPELVDTAFLVFQNKPVIFLHWFHHVTVLLYCWHAYHHEVSSGLWFASMNFFVHSIMYSYYFVMCSPNMIPMLRTIFKLVAPLITTIQILQMVGGMVVTVWGAYQTAYYPETCRIDQANYRLGLMMYSSYFLLFCSLFIGKFCSKSSPKATRSQDLKAVCNANITGDTAGFFHGRAMWTRSWSPRGERSPGSTMGEDAAPGSKSKRKSGGGRSSSPSPVPDNRKTR